MMLEPEKDWDDIDMERRRRTQNANLSRDHVNWGGCAEAKLSVLEARMIYKRLNWWGESVGDVAEDYVVGRSAVRQVGRRITWRWATRDLVD